MKKGFLLGGSSFERVEGTHRTTTRTNQRSQQRKKSATRSATASSTATSASTSGTSGTTATTSCGLTQDHPSCSPSSHDSALSSSVEAPCKAQSVEKSFREEANQKPSKCTTSKTGNTASLQKKGALKRGFLLSPTVPSKPTFSSSQRPALSKTAADKGTKKDPDEYGAISRRVEFKEKEVAGRKMPSSSTSKSSTRKGMKRGFLLAKSPESLQSMNSSNGDKRISCDNPSLSTSTQTIRNKDRNEAVESVDAVSSVSDQRKNNNASKIRLPQSQMKQRIQTVSKDLLEFEKGNDDDVVENHSIPSPNFLNFVGESEKWEHEEDGTAKNDFTDDEIGSNGLDTLADIGQSRHESGGNPSLDSWIQSPSPTSTISSSNNASALILPSSSHNRPQRKNGAKTSKPLIIELEPKSDSMPLITELETEHKLDRSEKNDNVRNNGCSNNPISIVDMARESPVEKVLPQSQAFTGDNKVCTATATEPRHESPPSTTDGLITTSGISSSKAKHDLVLQHNSIKFANEISLFLSRLRHSLRSKSRSRHSKGSYTNLGGNGSIRTNLRVGFGLYYTNKASHSLLNSFAAKHFTTDSTHASTAIKCNNAPHFNHLWDLTLEEIAQDYCTKSKRGIGSCAPLVLGLGVLELCNPPGVALESLFQVLNSVRSMDGLCTNGGSYINEGEQEERYSDPDGGGKENKKQKILALGAVCLVRCRVRCLDATVTVHEEELDSEISEQDVDVEGLRDGVEEMEQEVERFLTLLLPALERVVLGSDGHHSDEANSKNAVVRRTVLATAAMDACFELLEFSSRVFLLRHLLSQNLTLQDNPDENDELSTNLPLMKIWRDVLPIIERLLAVKLQWLSSNSKGESAGKGVGAQSQCAAAVLDDWKEIIKTSKRYFFDYIFQSNNNCNANYLHEGADFSAGLKLMWNMAGMAFKGQFNPEQEDLVVEKSMARIGGIAQSLCHKQENSPAFCSASLCDKGGFIDFEDVMVLLREACKQVEVIRSIKCSIQDRDPQLEKRRRGELWMHENQQRASIRAFVCFLGRRTKLARSSRKSAANGCRNSSSLENVLEEAMSNTIALLRSDSKCVVEMSLAALSALFCSSSAWISEESPNDCTLTSRVQCPQMFADLINALEAHSVQYIQDDDSDGSGDSFAGQKKLESSKQVFTDPSTKAFCAMVSTIAAQNPKHLFPFVINMAAPKEVMFEVVLNVVEQISYESQPKEVSSTSTSSSEQPLEIEESRVFVHRSAIDILLANIKTQSYLRERIQKSPSLFNNAPCVIVVPPMIGFLLKQYSEPEERISAATSSISELLCNIMKSNSVHHANEFIELIMASLHGTESNPPATSPILEKNSCNETFIKKNGAVWRRTLLEQTSLSDLAYKEILVASAKNMVNMPSSGMALALFASLVGTDDGSHHTNSSCTDSSEIYIFNATSGVLQFCLNQLSYLRKNSSNSIAQDAVKKEFIFQSLAPLLLLRRIPRSYYTTLHKKVTCNLEIKSIMEDLANFLSIALKTHATRNNQGNLEKEERRLLAELAGHCLFLSDCSTPDSSTSLDSISLFDKFCKIPFSDALKVLQGAPSDKLDKLRSINEAKSALYAVCHHVSLAHNDDNGSSLLSVAVFSLEVMQHQLDPDCEKKDGDLSAMLKHETIMLLSGCIHFFAVCFDSFSMRKIRHLQSDDHDKQLVEELDFAVESKDTQNKGGSSFIEALSMIFSIVQSLILSGKIEGGSLRRKFLSFHLYDQIDDTRASVQFSPASRTSLLNSIVLISQSSNQEDSRLEWLARSILPQLVDWASIDHTDNEIYHPLCIAAALQVMYTLIARLGSFEWLDKSHNGRHGHRSKEDFVCSTLQCALRCFKIDEGNRSVLSTMRLAALKVILTVLAVDQSFITSKSGQDLVGSLGPVEVQHAMSSLHGAANLDENPEIRRLASDLIPHFQQLFC